MGKKISSSNTNQLNCIAEDINGDYIAIGKFSGTLDTENGEEFSSSAENGMILKYAIDGTVKSYQAVARSGKIYINNVATTSDGGYIVVGEFYGEGITLENEDKLITDGYSDGIIIKYNENKEIEWYKVIKGDEGSGSEYLKSVSITKDNGYIIAGTFNSKNIVLGENITLTTKKDGRCNGMIIKLDANGTCEWAKPYGSANNFEDKINNAIGTSDGGVIAIGEFGDYNIMLDSKIEVLGNGTTGLIVKYDANGEYEWGKVIAQTSYLYNIVELTNREYRIVSKLNGDITLEDGTFIASKGKDTNIILELRKKSSSNPEVYDVNQLGNSNEISIISISDTNEGGYIVSGREKSTKNAFIRKYNANNVVEWNKILAGNVGNNQYYRGVTITKIIQTTDSGYIAVGYAHRGSRFWK